MRTEISWRNERSPDEAERAKAQHMNDMFVKCLLYLREHHGAGPKNLMFSALESETMIPEGIWRDGFGNGGYNGFLWRDE